MVRLPWTHCGQSTVEPGAFGGQPAGNACFAGLSFLQHCLIVLAQPGFNLLAHMPGGVIPNQHEHVFALRLDLLAQPQKTNQ